MLLTPNKVYQNEPFELEEDLEAAILEVREALFGDRRIYLDLKKKIGKKGKAKTASFFAVFSENLRFFRIF